MKNSKLIEAAKDEREGVPGPGGVRYSVSRRDGASSVRDERDDAAAARIRLKRKDTGEELGTFLVSMWFYPNYLLRTMSFAPHQFTLDDKIHRLELRFRREYLPFHLELLEFRHDKYMGTETPKNFSSRVRLVDPRRDEDREVLIKMNHPLRHAGMTFYQSGYFPKNDGTVLQAVDNPGWLIPYISCTLVSVGMLVHFLILLVGFLNRRAAA
jgi:hypothetical protein